MQPKLLQYFFESSEAANTTTLHVSGVVKRFQEVLATNLFNLCDSVEYIFKNENSIILH